MSKILLYDHDNMGYWELLEKTLCFNRSYHSGNHVRKALLLSSASTGVCGVWMRGFSTPLNPSPAILAKSGRKP